MGPVPALSASSYAYYVIFIDNFSRFNWFYPLKLKWDFYAVLENFQKFVETQFSRKNKVFQIDGGSVFRNNRLKALFLKYEIHHSMSCTYTPAQNGRTERKHKHITETGLAMFFYAFLSTKYWVKAFSSAVYIFNRFPSSVLGNCFPFELILSIPPANENFHVFCCRVYPCLRDYVANKFSP